MISFGNTDLYRLGGFYFTPQLEGAKQYACWMKQYHQSDEIVIIRIKVANSLMDGDHEPCVLEFPSSDFKKVVWHSRRIEPYSQDLGHIASATLIMSHTTRAVDISYSRMTSYEEITKRNLVLVDPDDASSFMIQ